MLSEKTTDQMPLPWLPLPTTQSSLSDVARQIYDGSSFDQEWKDLRFIPWRFFYLDYHHLQKDIVYGNIAKRLETEWSKVIIINLHPFFLKNVKKYNRFMNFIF